MHLRTSTRRSLGGLVLTASLFAVLLASTSVLVARDETSAFAAFQRALQAFDPNAILKAVDQDNSGLSPLQKRERFERKVTDAALGVMDRAGDFEKHYPQSQELRHIRNGAKQSISMAFGYMGLPIPPAREAEVEACTRELLRIDGKNDGLHMVLFRIAEGLPLSQQPARLEELKREATSGEACERVSAALRNLARLGLPLQLSFVAMGGHTISLAALKGKVVVIDFWAPSCGPCVRDLPGLKRFYMNHKTQGLEVLGISLDPDEAKLKKYLDQHPLPWPIKYDGSGSTNRVAQAFGIREIPVVWLVDRHGVLRDLKGRQDRDNKIEALLREP